MAKLKGPLFSLGASQQIGKALVYFPWKGLNVVREYVVPSNPRTTGQNTQRGYLTELVGLIHDMQAYAAHPLAEADTMAYALWGSTYSTPRTWFNQAVKCGVDARVASKSPRIYGAGNTTPGVATLAVELYEVNAFTTAGVFKYGTSKTAMIHSQASVHAVNKISATLAGLTAGIKYYWQFEATAPASQTLNKSGIYYGTPT